MFFGNANRIIGYTLALFTAGVAETYAQTWDGYVNVGYASYSHPELRAYQEYAASQLVVDAAITEEFPPFLTYALGVNANAAAWGLGVEIGHGSTGGRIYYADYSGKLTADQIVSFNYISFTPSVPLYRGDELILTAGLKVSVIRHKLSIRNNVTLGSDSFVEQADFLSGNFGLQPNVGIRGNITSRFFLLGSAGFEVQDRREARAPNNNSAFLPDENGEALHLQGSGFRLSIGTGVRF